MFVDDVAAGRQGGWIDAAADSERAGAAYRAGWSRCRRRQTASACAAPRPAVDDLIASSPACVRASSRRAASRQSRSVCRPNHQISSSRIFFLLLLPSSFAQFPCRCRFPWRPRNDGSFSRPIQGRNVCVERFAIISATGRRHFKHALKRNRL